MEIVDAMIPVWRPDARLKKSVELLLAQTFPVRSITLILSVDDSWDDRIIEQWFLAESRVRVVRIPKKEFNHGGTRQDWAHTSDADILLYMVQDAVPRGRTLVEKLVGSLADSSHAVVYARQLPGFGCDAIETYMRFFNYPARSSVKTKDALKTGSIKACFTSNVCAAYRRDWFEKLGGFEPQILLSEDSVYAAKALKSGANIIYNANAKVVHAHTYSYGIYWKRNFDIGAVHKMYDSIFGTLSSEKEGIRLVAQTALYLIRKRKVFLLPRLFALSGTKYLAYQAGKHYNRLPEKLRIRWSWDSDFWRRNNYE